MRVQGLSSSNNLHSTPWFLGAELSKSFVMVAIVLHFLIKMLYDTQEDVYASIAFDYDMIVGHGQIYRFFLYPITFAYTDEVVTVFGLLAQLMRRFEREMGSRKYASYLLKSITIATILQCLFYEFIAIGVENFPTPFPGPYPQLGALLHLYHKYTPRLHPKFFGLFGFDFSEKSLTYAFAILLMFFGGETSLLPTLCGMVGGYVCTHPVSPVGQWDVIPNAMADFCWDFGNNLGVFQQHRYATIFPSNNAGRHRRGTGGGNSASTRQRLVPDIRLGGVGGGLLPQQPMAHQFQPTPAPSPPNPEAVDQLTMMGFEREAVIRALQATDNNLEAAANRLLSGS